jgi:hypothetical protein
MVKKVVKTTRDAMSEKVGIDEQNYEIEYHAKYCAHSIRMLDPNRILLFSINKSTKTTPLSETALYTPRHSVKTSSSNMYGFWIELYFYKYWLTFFCNLTGYRGTRLLTIDFLCSLQTSLDEFYFYIFNQEYDLT